MAKTVVGLYEDKSVADRVVKDLESNGFDRDQINMTGQTGGQGRLVDHLESAGVPQNDAQYYMEGVRRGAVLVTVDSPDRSADEAATIMDRYDPINLEDRAGQWRQSGWQGGGQPMSSYSEQTRTTDFDMDKDRTRTTDFDKEQTRTSATDMGERFRKEGETNLPVTEEQMKVGKRQVQTGGVRVRTYVTEKPVEDTVNLHREHVEVERQPVDRPVTDADRAKFREGTFDVTETSEEAVVSKEPRVVEEVKVRKDVQDEQKTIRDTVRRQDVQTEDLGKDWGSGQQRFRSFDEYEPNFRNHFQSTFGNRGQQYSYDEYQPAYRYGYDLATGGRYQGQNWNDIEPEIRRDWERQYPNNRWEDFKGAVQQGWESITNK